MRTADDKDGGTEAKVYIVLIGTQACTDKIDLELIQKNGFEPGTAETFSVEGIDVGEIRKIEVGEWKYIVCLSSIITTIYYVFFLSFALFNYHLIEISSL